MKRMPVLLFVFVLVAFGACSGEEGPGTAGGTAETVTHGPVEGSDLPPAVLGGSVVQRVTSDGVTVTLEFLGVEGAPPRGGVVLVHMLGRSRADWEPLTETLISKGLDVVALDLRGHGQSVNGLDYESFDTEEWLGCANDIRAALDYLAEQVSGKIFLIGASIGANLVLIEAADDARVAGVVMLSPGSDYHGVKPGAYAVDYGERPALLVAAGDDAYSEKSVGTLSELLADPELKIYPSGGHGTYLFGSRPEVRALIADWLEKRFSE